MKMNSIKFFFLIELLIILCNFFNLFTLETITKIILVIYTFANLFIVNKQKNKQLNFYFILSIISTIAYSIYIELNLLETLTFVSDYAYIPITLIYLLNNYKKLNGIKARSKIALITISIILSLVAIINYIINKNISLNLALVIVSLYPLTLSETEKNKSFINIFIVTLVTFALILSNYNIVIYMLIVILIIYSIYNRKKNNVLNFIFIIIPILYLIIYNRTILNVELYVDKSFFFMLLEVIIYYIPILYILGKTTPKLKKYMKKSKDIFFYYLSILVILILGVYSSTIYLNIIFPIISSIILINYLNKLNSLTLKIDSDKITILALHLGYGGIEQYLSSLCMMLEETKEIEIIATYKLMNKPAFKFNKNIKIKYLISEGPNKEILKGKIKNKEYLSIFREGIKSLIILYKKYCLNIEAIENINSKYIITTRDFHNKLVGIYARSDITTIATEHNYHNDDKKYIKKVVKSVENIDYFVLVSKVLKDFYSNKVKAKCIFIPNVIDNLPKKKSNSTKHNIISVGRLSKEKGQADLIDVVSILKQKYKDIKLYLIGDGEEKDNLKKYIKHHKLEKNVELTGFLSKNDIELKMVDSSIFVTTSYTESFGLVVIEACSYKLPVVAFDSAIGIKTLLENGNGILIKNRNKDKMAKEIIKLFEEPEYRAKISNKGYENCQKYLAKNVKKEWLEIIK